MDDPLNAMRRGRADVTEAIVSAAPSRHPGAVTSPSGEPLLPRPSVRRPGAPVPAAGMSRRRAGNAPSAHWPRGSGRCVGTIVHLASALAVALLAHTAPVRADPLQPAVAFFYGAAPPLDELRAFDLVVLEPDHAPAPPHLPAGATRWYAYTSVGEIDARRSYAKDMPAAWLRGDNPAWSTRLVDHAAPGWAAFFEQRVIAPLWTQGWRGFFFDTLDAHRRFATTPAAQKAQEDALVALVDRLHLRFPGIKLVFNRGFELLPRLRGKVEAVAAESLYRGWDVQTNAYGEVSEPDRAWLLAQLRRVREDFGLPAIAIDYVAHKDRGLARETAARIRAHGLVPWVATGPLDTLGVGNVEVQPRRVLLVTDVPPGTDMQYSTAYRLLAMPLHWLGFTVDAIDVREPLPANLLAGRHIAIVTWFSQAPSALNPAFADWLKQQIDGGLRLVMFNTSAVDLSGGLARELGLSRTPVATGALRVERQDPIVGFEAAPPLDGRAAVGVQRSGAGDSLLRLRTAANALVDPVALTSWGGYALAPFAIRPPALDTPARWIVEPIEFLRRALDAPAFPVPDVTTESGRRLLLVHVDGDGFVSRAERAGAPFAGEVLLTDVLQRHRIPHTVSVIQGEVAGNGLFRELSPALEDIARRIFALPHVEIASHSYSHPFYWSKLQQGAGSGYPRALNLVLPGYTFDLATEIGGSIAYIDRSLAPAGKRTQVFLWTGDTAPPAEAVARTDAAGVLNMNGGDTLITRSQPTLTVVSGLGLRRGAGLQVFAPNQNENVYTGNWTGPFYGYQRAIETFELTESPRRLKPVNIYYHTYSATKAASLNALHRVYGWALEQPLVPVYASDYIRKVLDFHRMAVARDWRAPVPTWRIRGDGALRTLRLPAEGAVALAASEAVAGSAPGPSSRYLHLAAPSASVALAAEAATPVHVRDAAGRIEDFSRSPAGLRFTLAAYTTAQFTLAAARGCRARVDGRDLAPASTRGDDTTYELPAIVPAATPRRYVVDVRCGA